MKVDELKIACGIHAAQNKGGVATASNMTVAGLANNAGNGTFKWLRRIFPGEILLHFVSVPIINCVVVICLQPQWCPNMVLQLVLLQPLENGRRFCNKKAGVE